VERRQPRFYRVVVGLMLIFGLAVPLAVAERVNLFPTHRRFFLCNDLG